MLSLFPRRAALFVAALLCASPAFGIVVGEIDTFEDGTTEGWFAGGGPGGGVPPIPPIVIPTGGPDGVDDAYLQLNATGQQGPGGRLTAINTAQWAGNYLSAGVFAIAMEVNNLGQQDLFLRLLLENPAGGPPTDIALTANPIFLPAGAGWQTVVIPLDPGTLLAIQGTAGGALTSATAFRIFHSIDPTFPPEPVAAVLGIDNIRTIPGGRGDVIPEPTTAALMGIGLATCLLRRKRS